MPAHEERKGRDEEELEDIFHDLGHDLSRLLRKLADRASEAHKGGGFGFFDLGEFPPEFKFDEIQDLLKGFGFSFGPYDFEAKPKRERKQASATATVDETAAREPAVDVFDELDEVLIYVELPGVREEDISIQMKGRELRLEAPSPSARFAKTLSVPESAKGLPNYSFKNGILKIRFSKHEHAA